MAVLALNGGEPVVTSTLGKRWPIFGEREEKALLEVLHSGEWNCRDKVAEVGEAFAAPGRQVPPFLWQMARSHYNVP